MLARLKGMMQPRKEAAEPAAPAVAAPAAATETRGPAESAPTPPPAQPALPHEAAPAGGVPASPPLALPVTEPPPGHVAIPVAQPVLTGNGAPAATTADIPVALPVAAPTEVAAPVAPEAESAPEPEEAEAAEAPAAPEPEAPPFPCPVCGAFRRGEDPSCHDCGYYFSEADLARAARAEAAEPPAAPVLLWERFELRQRVGERGGVRRYRGLDHGDGSRPPVPVIVLEQDLPPPAPVAEPAPPAEPVEAAAEAADDIVPDFDEVAPSAEAITGVLPALPAWPSLAWEKALLESAEDPGLPGVVASFTEGGREYLVEEVPEGRPLWDAWDDPESDSNRRFGFLTGLADTLHRLHECGVILEGLRPDLVVIDASGHARLTDLADLLPLPLPREVPLRGTLYTAPELLAGDAGADARADLYSFGALLYALHVGRELSESDFDRPGHPKPFLPRFPDAHPAFGRLLTKTFRREVAARFPTDEASHEDATGFLELARTLTTLRRTLDNVRLEIAAWTTTGIVRTGNEDAYAVLHSCETRQDDCAESALVLLCDGMGGYEAGEVAAALTIQVLRQQLSRDPLFAHLGGASAFPHDALTPVVQATGHLGPPLELAQARQAIRAALREANRAVYQASRAPGSKRRGMGCTAEAVYLDGRNVVVGHVGDSRTYHLHEGRLIQMTRDQTLVNRLVELGTLTPEEAEQHPRRNELQQAVGGQPDVEPGLYHGTLSPGDWVVVCSDGLTNHVPADDLKHMLQSEATSAEMAARRLVNLANIEGATDNATVVVIRVT
jgi:serine/threonine protein phosphatase PrpC